MPPPRGIIANYQFVTCVKQLFIVFIQGIVSQEARVGSGESMENVMSLNHVIYYGPAARTPVSNTARRQLRMAIKHPRHVEWIAPGMTSTSYSTSWQHSHVNFVLPQGHEFVSQGSRVRVFNPLPLESGLSFALESGVRLRIFLILYT
jgi:hypothetical protein